MITVSLIVLAVLAYLGRSLVMLASVGGMAVALWLTDGGTPRRQVVALVVGAVGTSLAAECVHLVNHIVLGDAPDHGGFWVSAVLVGLINALAMLPALAFVHLRARGRAQKEGVSVP